MRRLTATASLPGRLLLRLVPGVRRLDRIRARAAQGPPSQFIERLLEALDVQVEPAPGALAAVPRSGPLVVAVDHPTGILDGLVAVAVLRRVRPDVRILANLGLAVFVEAREIGCLVDPFGWPGSSRRSFKGLRAALRWLRLGGALVVFPAGEVGHVDADGTPRDPAWKPAAGQLILATGAAAAVMHLDARPSATLRLADRIHPLLRTLTLFHELLRQRGATVRVAVATALPAAATAAGISAPDLTARLRTALDGLARQDRSSARPAPVRPTAPAVPKDRLRSDVAHLHPSRHLTSSGPLVVYGAAAPELPHVLDEIGRLREIAFRDAGEGTGRARDLDEFDQTYHHLFVWNRETHEIAGAYRVGFADELTRTAGVEALYSRTLFAYDDRLLGRLGPALELGRSFVRLEYQRHHAPLMLLWQGIGRIVAREPRYRVLFGLVSITSRYTSTTRRLLMEFLKANHLDRTLAELVRATGTLPPALRPAGDTQEFTAQSLDDMSRVVREIERDGRGVPVLLRQYLKLNARLLGFNVDPAFGDALDGFLMVDLTEVDRRILNRFLGRAESSRFLAYHAQRDQTAGGRPARPITLEA